MRKFSKMPQSCRQVVGYLLPHNDADAAGYSWTLYLQLPVGDGVGRQHRRGIVVDGRGALRYLVSFRTLDVLTDEGYIKEHPRKAPTVWRPRGSELPHDLRGVREVEVTEYVLTPWAREAVARPYAEIDVRDYK